MMASARGDALRREAELELVRAITGPRRSLPAPLLHVGGSVGLPPLQVAVPLEWNRHSDLLSLLGARLVMLSPTGSSGTPCGPPQPCPTAEVPSGSFPTTAVL